VPSLSDRQLSLAKRLTSGAAVFPGRGMAQGLDAREPGSRGWMYRSADLLACLFNECQPEHGIACVDLKCGQAPQHVSREQVMPSLARRVDRQPVVRPRRADVAHICVQPRGQPCRFAEGRSKPAGQR
jgi:hypothetical protein